MIRGSIVLSALACATVLSAVPAAAAPIVIGAGEVYRFDFDFESEYTAPQTLPFNMFTSRFNTVTNPFSAGESVRVSLFDLSDTLFRTGVATVISGSATHFSTSYSSLNFASFRGYVLVEMLVGSVTVDSLIFDTDESARLLTGDVTIRNVTASSAPEPGMLLLLGLTVAATVRHRRSRIRGTFGRSADD